MLIYSSNLVDAIFLLTDKQTRTDRGDLPRFVASAITRKVDKLRTKGDVSRLN